MAQPGTIPHNVLLQLNLQKRREPRNGGLETDQIVRLVKSARGPVHTALTRYVKRGLVTRKRFGGRSRYAITSKGVDQFMRAGLRRPWQEGTIVQTDQATYRVLSLLRTSSESRSPRVAVFTAQVEQVVETTADRMTSGEVVILKTLANEHVRELLDGDPTIVTTYLATLTRAFFEETQKLPPKVRPQFEFVANTLDWGHEPLRVGNKESRVPFVIQEYIGGLSLEDAPEEIVRTAGQWFDVAEKLAQGLKEVHAVGKFHRRISPATIYMRKGSPVCVDLMEAVFHVPDAPEVSSVGSEVNTDSRPVAALPFSQLQFVAPELRKVASTSTSCASARSPEPRRTADLFSVGAVLYYLATRRPPAFTTTNRETLKTEVSAAVRGSVADQNYGIADVTSRCLRAVPAERMADAYALLADIRTFRDSRRPPDVFDVVNRVRRLSALEPHGVFASLATVELDQFERVLSELETGSVSVRGGHDNLVIKLCSYLSTLRHGDEYWAVSVPDFWRANNLGIQGRYLSMNAEIVRRGAKVLRVFLLTRADLVNKEVADIIHAHCELERSLTNGAQDMRGELEARYLIIGDEEQKKSIREGDQLGLWVSGDSLVSVRPFYNTQRQINRVTISKMPGDRATVKKKWFDRYFQNAKSLHELSLEASGPALRLAT